MARWHSCNVFQTGKDSRQLWQFTVSGGHFNLAREEKKLLAEPLPAKLISKDWHTLLQKKLNVAWLPADKIFLRVVQLPASDFAEMQSMLELQLEKISPLPVAQIVWSFELLAKKPGGLLTAVVIIVARSLVEEFLGQLEAQGYYADQLEVPLIDQLLATKVEDDGVWIYPGAGAEEQSCLIAWWQGGVLRNLSLLHLPKENRVAFIRDQLAQMTWAGELEGWLTGAARQHLVADATVAAEWEDGLRENSDAPVLVSAPLPPAQLAALTARRAAQAAPRVPLVPPEHVTRYRQLFVDHIWMRALGAVLVAYLFGTLVYFGALEFLKYQIGGVEQHLATLSGSYTNAIKLREKTKVMQDQLSLQYAALDCWKAAAELLPEDLTLDGLRFEKGKTLTIFGTAPEASAIKVTGYYDALRKVIVKDQPLFITPPGSKPPSITTRGNQISWSFVCELKRTDSE
ncbi:MAG: hypothetical protein EXS33_06670 [Pedosphaera sp.]|nr:hypothetical protein [Pedosphaera sp.]